MGIIVPDVLLESSAFDEFRKVVSSDVDLVLSYAFDYRLTGFSVPRGTVSALILRKRPSIKSSPREVLMSVATPLDEAIHAFSDFRVSHDLW